MHIISYHYRNVSSRLEGMDRIASWLASGQQGPSLMFVEPYLVCYVYTYFTVTRIVSHESLTAPDLVMNHD